MARKKRKSGTALVRPKAEITENIRYVDLGQETRRRYLNYAMSVITSRALPDVRDGLKPVQRRIMYVMYNDLRLEASAKPRKCMKICGDTTGNYHPHGDSAVYEALVRLAQDFTMREPLVDGQGNFGSVLGLPPAAARYTEARLTAIAEQLMSELKFRTVEMRPNYDATQHEPVVLPARFPNLLVNGTSGIAVGMATNIPPHNLSETIKACQYLIKTSEPSAAKLAGIIKGPDFPLGGRIMTDRKAIRQIYEEGRGSIRVRGEWRLETDAKGREIADRVVIYSVPYGVNTGPLVQELGNIVEGRKIPQLLAVNDETDKRNGLRITLQLKSPGDADTVMAYLFKHTALEQNFACNFTALVPDGQGMLSPRRLSLVEMLQEFLNFRLATVRKRLKFQLQQLEKRIHILKGFAIVFDGIDKAVKIIRSSEGKEDACEKLMKAFPLDRDQTMAILELQLYRLSQIEIDAVLAELEQKQTEANRITKLLASETALWQLVHDELEELNKQFGSKRRTSFGSDEEITEFDPNAYIVKENTHVVITRDGWVKRVGTLKNIESTRVREGDAVLAVCPASTLDQVAFFASDGTAYTLPVQEIPVSSGYGEPLGKFVKMGDGVRVVNAITTDPRFTPPDTDDPLTPSPLPHLFVATEGGFVTRLPFGIFRQPSTKSGRRYMRLQAGDRVIHVELCDGGEALFLASRQARLLHFRMSDVPVISGAGKGVKGLSLEGKDAVIGAQLLRRPSDTLHAINDNGNVLSFGQMKYSLTSRGGKGIKTSQRTGLKEIQRPEITLADWSQVADPGNGSAS